MSTEPGGAAWEQRQAVEKVAEVTRAYAEGLPPALSDLVTAVASAAASQSAAVIVSFEARLKAVEDGQTEILRLLRTMAGEK